MKRYIVFAALVACSKIDPPTAPAAPADAAASSYDPAALRKAWRESVKYRAAKVALANNANSLASDLAKVDRMLATTEAYRRLPEVSDVAGDAAAVKAALAGVLATLEVEGRVEVEPATLVPVPTRRSTEEGIAYNDAQLAPAHTVRVQLAEGLVNGPRFMRALKRSDRLFIVDRAWVEKGTGFLVGKVHFFRDLKPVEFALPPRDAEAIVRSITKVPSEALDPKGQQVAAKIRANYAQVEAARERMKASLAHEANLAIRQARFAFFAKHVDAFNAVTWSGLIGGKKKKAPHAGHGHPH